MLEGVNIENILFLDIETVPQTYQYKDLDDTRKKLWDEKFRYLQNETPESYYKKAGIYAEFARIVCISVGILKGRNLKLKSFYGHDEKKVLEDFSALLNKYFFKPFNKREGESYNSTAQLLCGHNGKEFDFPFIARRMLINGISLPKFLNISGKKPWETDHLLDTMELWKFGDNKNFTSLNLLAHSFGIPTPKDEMHGGDVARVYYEENNLEKIATYCQKDVVTVAQLIVRFKGMPLLEPHEVNIA